jgi:SAM-dependent methyltransferase
MRLHAQDLPGDSFPEAPRTNRPRVRLSDLWKAPLHDLPVRDEILFQYLPLNCDMRVLEVGPGSGHTAFRAAKLVREITLVDISADNIARLRHVLSDSPGLRAVCADVCNPDFAAAVGGPFDALWAFETFQYVADPRGTLANFASVLRPGGTLLVQFPNYTEPRSPGPTHYKTREALDDDLRAAGFGEWEVYSLSLSPQARWIYSQFHERPLNTYRRLRIRRDPHLDPRSPNGAEIRSLVSVPAADLRAPGPRQQPVRREPRPADADQPDPPAFKRQSS